MCYTQNLLSHNSAKEALLSLLLPPELSITMYTKQPKHKALLPLINAVLLMFKVTSFVLTKHYRREKQRIKTKTERVDKQNLEYDFIVILANDTSTYDYFIGFLWKIILLFFYFIIIFLS